MDNFLVDTDDIRLDVFLARTMNFSRARAQKLIENGNVTINDKSIVKSNRLLKIDDNVAVYVPPPEETEIVPENIPIDIIYEDNDIIVINKARGIVVHPAAGNYSGTLVNALLFHSKNLSGINGKIRPGIVHRLDKDTSGVMVVAKNDAAHLSLSEQIASKQAKRIYLAIVHGNLKNDFGEIEGDIGRHPKDRKKMAVVSKNGKYAKTLYRVLTRFKDYCLIACELKTGRTHQIRVHMAHIGHPVACDPLYGTKKNAPFKINGQALHSAKLSLIHPNTNEEMEFFCKLPEDMRDILRLLRK